MTDLEWFCWIAYQENMWSKDLEISEYIHVLIEETNWSNLQNGPICGI